MRDIKEILRQRYNLKLSQQEISNSRGIPRSTIRDYLSRVQVIGLTWPLPEDMDNDKLNALLFPNRTRDKKKQRPTPSWETVHSELKRKGVTLQLLWEEYRRIEPDGYQYSWYAESYRQWLKGKEVWMVQSHCAGEKVFVDYSGVTMPIWKTNLIEISHYVEIFVATLGASDLIFCLASESQKLDDWIFAHVEMFNYYGGVTALIVPDNLRSGVTKAHRYEPICNRTYEELAEHYGCAVMPARSRKPQDKAKVEKSVQIIQQRVLAQLRNEKFTSLSHLNEAMKPLLEKVNNKKFQKLPYSRRQLFSKIEEQELLVLPGTNYKISHWHQETVNGGYHIYANDHYYSVPYQYARKKIDIRVSKNTVECFYKEKCIAKHHRDDTPHRYTTIDSHRPEAHRQQAMWHSEKLIAWAQGIGNNTAKFIHQLLQDKSRHLYQKERSALGILRLSNAFDEQRLEIACKKAIEIGTISHSSIVSIIKTYLKDSLTSFNEESTCSSQAHENVRGSDYYH